MYSIVLFVINNIFIVHTMLDVKKIDQKLLVFILYYLKLINIL
jgi:hypothetical protein